MNLCHLLCILITLYHVIYVWREYFLFFLFFLKKKKDVIKKIKPYSCCSFYDDDCNITTTFALELIHANKVSK